MLFAFNASMAMLVSVLSTFLTGLLLVLKSGDLGAPVSAGITLMLVSGVGMMMLLSSVPKLYRETVKRCHDDIEGFVKEQSNIAKRCTRRSRIKVKKNLIFGLLTYNRLEEAESLLNGIFPSVEKSRCVLNELDCLLYRLELAQKRYDEESCAYLSDKLLDKIKNAPELSPLERVEYENRVRIRQLETAFFTRPEILSEAEMQEITKQLNFFAGMYLSQQLIEDEWYDYFYMHFNYLLGVTYAAMQETRSAEFYLGLAAAQPVTYPEVIRARQYLQNKDMAVFFEQQPSLHFPLTQ